MKSYDFSGTADVVVAALLAIVVVAAVLA